MVSSHWKEWSESICKDKTMYNEHYEEGGADCKAVCIYSMWVFLEVYINSSYLWKCVLVQYRKIPSNLKGMNSPSGWLRSEDTDW